MACRAIIKAVKRVSRQGAAPEHMVRMCDVIGAATWVGARGMNNTVEADEALEAVKEKHPTHEALQYQCAKVKAALQEVRRELERERMKVEDNDLVRMGMETERMSADDKDVGGGDRGAATTEQEDETAPSPASRCRESSSGGDAAMGAATHGGADATSGGHLLPAPWYASDVDMTPWVRQWAPNHDSNDYKRLTRVKRRIMRCHTGKGLTCAEVRPGHRPRLTRIVCCP